MPAAFTTRSFPKPHPAPDDNAGVFYGPLEIREFLRSKGYSATRSEIGSLRIDLGFRQG